MERAFQRAVNFLFRSAAAKPDIERIVHARLDSRLAPIQQRLDDFVSHFDAIYKRFDRVDSEFASLTVIADFEK